MPSESSHATGSSHVKMQTIVDYAWEHKYYDGHIAACRGEYLAYAIKGTRRDPWREGWREFGVWSLVVCGGAGERAAAARESGKGRRFGGVRWGLERGTAAARVSGKGRRLRGWHLAV